MTTPSDPRDPGKTGPTNRTGPSGRPNPTRWIVPVVGVILVLIVVIVVLSRSSTPTTDAGGTTAAPPTTTATPAEEEAPPAVADADFTGSGFPHADAKNRRQFGGPINRKTVDRLESAWSHPLDGAGNYGSYAASPIVSRGVIYSQDLASNVEAIDLKTGELLWRTPYDMPSAGPNGVNVSDGRVYATTPTAAFALDQKTGKELWSVTLANGDADGIDMAPGYHDGLVYVSTVPVSPGTSDYSASDVGTLWALDARTGKKRWHFDTIKKERGRPTAAGGGLWYSPAFDNKGGMYFGVGNPSPWPGTDDDPWGSGRPGPNLYSNSLVKLDAKTGTLDWYYQQTPHDIYDWDLQGPPILVTDRGRQMVVIGGKSGFVLALDRESGDVLWKRSVGRHNGHDRDNIYAMRKQYKKLKAPAKIYPGILGGVISPMATDGRLVFVPVINNPANVISPAKVAGSNEMEGELIALSVATGKPVWTKKLPSASFGAVSVVNDLVFATTIDGKILAYRASNGAKAWSDALESGTNTGITVSGSTLIAPAGLATQAGQTPHIKAYRLRDAK